MLHFPGQQSNRLKHWSWTRNRRWRTPPPNPSPSNWPESPGTFHQRARGRPAAASRCAASHPEWPQASRPPSSAPPAGPAWCPRCPAGATPTGEAPGASCGRACEESHLGREDTVQRLSVRKFKNQVCSSNYIHIRGSTYVTQVVALMLLFFCCLGGGGGCSFSSSFRQGLPSQ